MGTCIRCGQNATQYGTDGLSYCDSCLFYGMNKQCQKCGMYLPSLELQMYRGQWYCPYCVMDLKEEHRKPHEKKKEDYHTQTVKDEHCDRCGMVLSTVVYIFKGRKLCETCLNQEKGEDSGPVSPPVMKITIQKKQEPFYTPIIKPAGLFADGLFSWILRKLGLKKRQQEAEVVEVIQEEEKQSKKEKTESKKQDKEKTEEKIVPIKKEKEKKEEEVSEEKEQEEEEEPEEKEKTDWSKHKKD